MTLPEIVGTKPAMDAVYSWRTSGRSPIWFLTLAVGSGMSAAGLWFKPPPPVLWWLPIGGVTLVAIWMIVRNPRHGIELSPDGLTVIAYDKPVFYPSQRIDHLEIADWSDGTSYRLHLRDGEVLPLFSGSFPGRRTVEAEARRFGLGVRVS